MKLLSLATLFVAFVSSSHALPVKGLEDVSNLDHWTSALYGAKIKESPGIDSIKPNTFVPAARALKPFQIRSYIMSVYENTDESTSMQLVFNQLLGLAKKQSNVHGYYQLAQSIFGARSRIQRHFNRPVDKKFTYLLQVLGEEVLLALYDHSPKKKKHFKQVFDPAIPESAYEGRCQSRDDLIKGVPVCQGDILISKGGAGSSALLSRIADYPGNMSHSTIAYVDPETKTIHLPEAYIEDGVKLRTPKPYLNGEKKKFYLYRSKKNSGKALRAVTSALDEFVEKMRFAVDDPAETKVWDYDFSMMVFNFFPPMAAVDHYLFRALEGIARAKMFCSEIPFHIFRDAQRKEPSVKNPYSNWSSISGVNREFFQEVLGLSQFDFPAPSDVEANKDFQLVGFEIDMSRLREDRVDNAMIDALFSILRANQEQAKGLMLELEKVGNSKVEPHHIDEIAAAGILPEETIKQLRENVPEDVSMKQLVFFGLLDQMLTPYIREKQLLSNPEPRGLMKLRDDIQAELGQVLVLAKHKVAQIVGALAVKEVIPSAVTGND